MKKLIFINSDEILLAMCSNESENTAQSGPFYDETEVLNFLSGIDDVERIIRIELSTNRWEDISEEIAKEYLDQNSWLLDEESDVPPFVEYSNAYEIFKKDLEDQKIDDEIYGTYEEQHRLRLSDVI
ncbi:hypothetical protein Bcsk_004960 [Bartonella sp. CDC_skunk]|uniref:hypothetical protein n=1 Tax=unclassified Bartonella TaxID=2645622 RepID=UPI00099AAE99|nr:MULTISPECIES: hypothetical protein [unclassified Bartonella]AQX21154.1 hypothetical protein Bcsk_004960 [Bartonella sp. CDC_skunk]AQX26412.1 hypothetical protein Bra60_003920 [Bartonella sp. Raccoon60]